MKDQINRTHRGDGKSTSTAARSIERRSAQRQPFIAEAHIVEVNSGAKLSARSCDLVVHGCYVDTLNPFPVGTHVRIRLTKDKTSVEADGNVVYRVAGLGMGIAFHDLTSESRAALTKWLSHTREARESLEVLIPPPPASPGLIPVIQRQVSPEFIELIQMLQKKGILTTTEVTALLGGAIEI